LSSPCGAEQSKEIVLLSRPIGVWLEEAEVAIGFADPTRGGFMTKLIPNALARARPSNARH
jgi:hypothetical protein